MKREQIKGAARPTLAEARRMLEERGWTYGLNSWEDEEHVYAFAAESYPNTYGGAAAEVVWQKAGPWLSLPESKPTGVRFV